MKIYNILLLFCFAMLLTSCITKPENHPDEEDFLCVINADGTGFQKFPYPSIPGTIWDMYVTKDGKLIFASDKYYITDPDSIIPVPFIDITPNSYGLTLANDGKAYYCQNGDLYKYNFVTQIPINLTENIDGFFSNPLISPDDSIITLKELSQDSTNTSILCFFRLSDNSMHFLPEAGSSTRRGIYNPLTNKIYHEQTDGLYKIDLDGHNNTHLLTYTSLMLQVFGLNPFSNYLVIIDPYAILRIFNISTELIDFNHALSDIRIIPKVTKYANEIFYSANGILFIHNLDNNLTFQIPNTSGVEYAMCPTWDGNKIYYFARLRVNK
jgi:hypothetical protein